MKRTCPTVSPLGSQLICPFRIMFIASYPAIVLSAPFTDRKPLTGHYPLFYETMVLLDSVVQVTTGSTPAPRTQLSGASEFVDHRWISGMAVHIDNAGSNPTR